MKKKIFKILISIFLSILSLGVIYIFFMIITDYKPEEKISINVSNNRKKIIEIDNEISLTTFNVGYGTMDKNVDFFMDGGKMSRGISKEITLDNLHAIENILINLNSDILFLQEVDVNSTRSYKINQLEQFQDIFSDYSSNFAINYKVPFVPVPIDKPHGTVLAGITTFSKFNITSATRYDLPGKSSFFVQLADLDRCILVNRHPVDNDKELVTINAHLSAYDKGGLIRQIQLDYIKILLEEESEKGNYVIIGGDWNQQIPGTNAFDFPTTEPWPEWLKDIPSDSTPEGYTWSYDASTPTNRTVSTPYIQGENFTSIIDGFLVSNNIEIVSTKATNTNFEYTDHNPVTLTFKLKP